MGSYDFGKNEVSAWVQERFQASATILDVGACDSKWRRILPEYPAMDAVEVFDGYLDRLQGYRQIYHTDICDFRYDWYDLIIFGDVIEHLTVDQAQAVLRYAWPRCRDMVVAVPWLYYQGPVNGNVHEIHIQDDLTLELFDQRYPGFKVLCHPREDYCYFVKGDDAHV